jgi:hypothetical protein
VLRFLAQRYSAISMRIGGIRAIGTLGIPANGQTSLFLNQIPGIQTLVSPFRGMLELTSFDPITIIGLRAQYNERTDVLITTTPPADESVPPSASNVFPGLRRPTRVGTVPNSFSSAHSPEKHLPEHCSLCLRRVAP